MDLLLDDGTIYSSRTPHYSFDADSRNADDVPPSSRAAAPTRMIEEEHQAEEGEMEDEQLDDTTAAQAAGLVAAALRLTPMIMVPGDVTEVPNHLARVKLGTYVSISWPNLSSYDLMDAKLVLRTFRQWISECVIVFQCRHGHQGRHSPISAPPMSTASTITNGG